MRVSSVERTANYLMLGLFAIFAIYPLLGVVIGALGTDTGGAAGGVANFTQAWHVGRFGDYLGTSALVSLFVVSLSTVCSIMAGYAFGTMRFRGSQVVFYVFLLGIMMPAEAIVVPLYIDLQTAGLTDTFWAIELPQVAQSVAFGTFWLRAYFRTSYRAVVGPRGSTAPARSARCGACSSPWHGRRS